jgi:hypothetical protein
VLTHCVYPLSSIPQCRRGDLIVIKKHRVLPETLVEIPADYEESEVLRIC